MTSTRNDGRIEFRFYRPNVRRVGVAGCFNEWQDRALEMKPSGNGWWTATADLRPGEYRFRYVADGVWYTDFAAYGVEYGKMGCNSVLLVPDVKAESTTDE